MVLDPSLLTTCAFELMICLASFGSLAMISLLIAKLKEHISFQALLIGSGRTVSPTSNPWLTMLTSVTGSS